MTDTTCDWAEGGKTCRRLSLTDTCVWTDGKSCVQAPLLQAFRERFEHRYLDGFAMALLGAAITCVIFFFRAVVRQATWDAFWSDPQIWIPNTVGWPIVCLLIALALPKIENGDLRVFFMSGLTFPGFIYALLGLGVEKWAGGS